MCEAQVTNKYLTRKSPPYPANKCCGKIKRGNDDRKYQSIPNKNGVCRWVPLNSKSSSRNLDRKSTKKRRKSSNRSKHRWLTLNNHRNQFEVVKEGKHRVVISEAKNSKEEGLGKYSKVIKAYDVDRVFVGKSPKNPTTKISGNFGPNFDGNSILLKLKNGDNRYVFVGDTIYEFESPEQIIQFYSSVGRNAVPYPVAVGKKYAYFMLDSPKHYKSKRGFRLDLLRKDLFPENTDWSDAYTDYYLESFPVSKKLKVKMIREHL